MSTLSLRAVLADIAGEPGVLRCVEMLTQHRLRLSDAGFRWEREILACCARLSDLDQDDALDLRNVLLIEPVTLRGAGDVHVGADDSHLYEQRAKLFRCLGIHRFSPLIVRVLFGSFAPYLTEHAA